MKLILAFFCILVVCSCTKDVCCEVDELKQFEWRGEAGKNTMEFVKLDSGWLWHAVITEFDQQFDLQIEYTTLLLVGNEIRLYDVSEAEALECPGHFIENVGIDPVYCCDEISVTYWGDRYLLNVLR